MFRRSSVALACLFLLIPSAHLLAQAQTRDRTLGWVSPSLGSRNEKSDSGLRITPRIDEVEIVQLLSSGKPIIIDQPFAADDDWLRSITIRVRNVSGRRLKTVQLDLELPELGLSTPLVQYCHGCGIAQKEKGIAPGEEVELKTFDDAYFKWVNGRIAEKGLARVVRAQVREMWVTLSDGTVVMSGCVKTVEPKNACSASP